MENTSKKNATLELMPDEQLPSNSETNTKNVQPFAPSKMKQENSRAIAESAAGLLAHAPAIASNDVESIESAARETTNHNHKDPFPLPGAYCSEERGHDPNHNEDEDLYTITNTDHQQAAALMSTAEVHVQARLVPDEAPDGDVASSLKPPSNDGFPVVAAAEQISWMSKIPLGAWIFAGFLVLAVIIGVAIVIAVVVAVDSQEAGPMLATRIPNTDLQIACSWIEVDDISVCQNTTSTSNGTGPIPPQLGMLTQLIELDLDNNVLTGTIPIQLGMLTQLTWLALSVNALTGSIPTQLGMLTQLNTLRLYNNSLTGSMPESICASASPRIDCGQITCSCCEDSGQLSCP